MSEALGNKVALVTGGGSGIGRAAALAFAREGARVVVSDIAVEGGEETARHIQAAGGEAIFLQADVTQASEVDAMVHWVIERYGRLDCALNNAGIGERASITECTEDQWDRITATNLKGVWLCMKSEIPPMLSQKRGVIVNTASVAGLSGVAGLGAYVASKHGVVGITKTAALEYASAGIRINAICPGWVRTPMVEPALAADPRLESQISSTVPTGRIGEPEEIAGAVIWLCSDAAAYVTGHSMVLDGGLTAH